jgi:hypothetical protein
LAISRPTSRPFLLVAGLAISAGTTFAANTHRAIVSKVSPAYPELARRMHVSGTIDADGKSPPQK